MARFGGLFATKAAHRGPAVRDSTGQLASRAVANRWAGGLFARVLLRGRRRDVSPRKRTGRVHLWARGSQGRAILSAIGLRARRGLHGGWRRGGREAPARNASRLTADRLEDPVAVFQGPGQPTAAPQVDPLQHHEGRLREALGGEAGLRSAPLLHGRAQNADHAQVETPVREGAPNGVRELLDERCLLRRGKGERLVVQRVVPPILGRGRDDGRVRSSRAGARCGAIPARTRGRVRTRVGLRRSRGTGRRRGAGTLCRHIRRCACRCESGLRPVVGTGVPRALPPPRICPWSRPLLGQRGA